MRIRDVEFAAIDFESAGVVRGATDVPIQVGIAMLRGDSIGSPFKSYLRSDRPVAWSARRVHGIADEDIADAPSLLSLWPEIRARLGGRWIVSHGAGTEKRFLRSFPAHGFGPWVDTLKLCRAAVPTADSHSLGSLAAQLDCEQECLDAVPGFRWHDALCDAVASLVILRRVIALCGLSDAPVDVLLNPDDQRYYALRASRLRSR